MKFKELTEEVAEREGLKRNVSIGQIKEITRIILQIQAEDPVEALRLIAKYR